MANGTYRLSESLKDILRTFFHFWSLVFVLIVATLLALLAPTANAGTDITGIASSIFQVSGTMVALVLPASELANNFVTKFSDELFVIIESQTGVSPEKKEETITNLSDELRLNLGPAWRASIYALSSFLLSCLAMFVPSMKAMLGSVPFSFGHFLLGLSLGFVMAGAFWFFPTARYIFRLKLLDDVKRFAQRIGGAQKKNP
jgi:hypothetical protein